MNTDLEDYEVMEEFFQTRRYDQPGKDWRTVKETAVDPDDQVFKHDSFALVLKAIHRKGQDTPENMLRELRKLPSSAEIRKLIQVLESRKLNRPGVAGFSLAKTREMMDFHNWMTQTPDGIQWYNDYQNALYKHPGDPEYYWEQRYVYKPGYHGILKYNKCHDPKTGKFCTGPGFGFVSPSTEENTITPTVAAWRMNSEDQQRFLEASKKVDDLLGLRATVTSAVGAWSDGAENTTMTTYEGATYEQVKLSAAMKGLLGQQKAVIPFQSNSKGRSRVLSVKVPEQDPAKLNQFLVNNGVEFHTLIPHNGGTEVVVFSPEPDRKLVQALKRVADHSKSEVTQRKGDGEFLGSWDSREEGRKEYEKVIDAYMRNKPAKRRMWEKIKMEYGV